MTDEAPSIYRLMGRVLADLPAVGKDDFNKEQQFHFRGHDAVMNALNPVLGRYGVFVVPEVLERLYAQRTTRSGGIMHEVNLHVRFRFYGPAGDYVEASAWGEGTDMGDKATNKAMTNAFKYCLVQVFAISTKEVSDTDADRSSPDESVPDVAACPREGCGAMIDGALTSKEPMRQHHVEVHGWIRQEDGTVVPPDKVPPTAPTPPQAPAPAPEPAPERPAAPTPPPPSDPPPPDPDPEPDPEPDDVGQRWNQALEAINAMKGRELQDALREAGLDVGGRIAELRERLIEYVRGQLFDESWDSEVATINESSADDEPDDDGLGDEPVYPQTVGVITATLDALDAPGRKAWDAYVAKHGLPVDFSKWTQKQAMASFALLDQLSGY